MATPATTTKPPTADVPSTPVAEPSSPEPSSPTTFTPTYEPEGRPELWLLVCRVTSPIAVHTTEALNLPQGCVLRSSVEQGGMTFQGLTYMPNTNWDATQLRFT